MLDMALRLGFERAQTKGKVGKYLRGNLWPSIRDRTCDAGVVRGGGEPARARLLAEERLHLGGLPDTCGTSAGWRRTATCIGRAPATGCPGDGRERRCRWGRLGDGGDLDGRAALAVHPRAERPGERFTAPGQWEGLPRGDGRPPREAVAVQVAVDEVERRSLDVYELAAAAGAR